MGKKYFQIAIDGPVAAGKGTVSRLVAEKLDFFYVDTGAMYRAVALLALRHQLQLTDVEAISTLLLQAKIEMRNPQNEKKDGRLVTIILNGEDVSWAIRTEEISRAVSPIAALAKVRKILVKKQQQIAQSQDVVVEGRDITYRVLPKADLKIYLTASDLVRAKRRHFQLLTRGEVIDFQSVHRELVKRDQRDISRKTDPLKVVPEAWVIDSSDLSIEQVVDLIVTQVRIMRDETGN